MKYISFFLSILLVNVGIVDVQSLITPIVNIIYIPLVCESSIFGPAVVTQEFIDQLNVQLIQCSNGKFAIGNGTIVNSPITIPCSLQSIKTCDNFYEWENYIPIEYLLIRTKYLYFITPHEYIKSCPIGQGEVNGRKSWIRHDKYNDISTHLHELGHNWGLDHANTLKEEYADMSSVMGYCCNIRCFNPPQVDYLNWTRTVIHINSKNLQVDKRYTYNTTSLSYDYLLLNNKYYIGYRQNIDGDFGLQPPWYGNILIHIMNENGTTTIISSISLEESYMIIVSKTEKVSIEPIYLDKYIATLKITKENLEIAINDFNEDNVTLYQPPQSYFVIDFNSTTNKGDTLTINMYHLTYALVGWSALHVLSML
jgi:Gametolysin peptidase M11